MLRVCLDRGGGSQVGEVTCGGLPHLSCKRDQIKMRDYMDRRVTHLSGLPHPPVVSHLLSYWFMWILRNAKRSLPLITSVLVFITKF